MTTVLPGKMGPFCFSWLFPSWLCFSIILWQFPPLFAKDRILDQARNHRSNLEPELGALPKVVLANHRVLKTGLDVDWSLAYLNRLSGEEPDGNVPFVTRRGLIVVGDRRIHPDLPGIWQVECEEIEDAPLAYVGRVLILAARSDFPEVVREDPGRHELGLVAKDNGRTESPLVIDSQFAFAC